MSSRKKLTEIPKSPTGIHGLDEITAGGLPKGRPTLVCGGPGCGKTLFGVEFLFRGMRQFDEPGVFMSFEETISDLTTNVASLGFDVEQMIRDRKLVIDHVHIERGEIEETGEYDLDGLFIRLNHAIDSIGAKRVVLDTLETLFSSLSNEIILRAELKRLFSWLKDKKVTAVITAEKGKETFTRNGLEEYVSDCVIFLDHRVNEQISTRRLRVVKYRGSVHGTNEYPFLIDEKGITVLPITSLGLQHSVSAERISTGVERLDNMLGGMGYYRGTSILITGTAGTGKSTLAAHFVEAACKRGERCLYLAFEESPPQIIRNMRSIGIDLEPWIKRGLLRFHAARPTTFGLEMHLATLYKLLTEFEPGVTVADPITNLIRSGNNLDAEAALTRMIDLLKGRHTTALFTSLIHRNNTENSQLGVSSLMDTWISLQDIGINGERNLGLYVLKARGINHSRQIREFSFTKQGIKLTDVYLGVGGILTGSSRMKQEALQKSQERMRLQEIERKKRDLDRRRKAMEAQIASIQAEFESIQEEIMQSIAQNNEADRIIANDRVKLSELRRADRPETSPASRKVQKQSRSSTNGKGEVHEEEADKTWP